jgi:predicted negative regulator of RcsB-dependent stress response
MYLSDKEQKQLLKDWWKNYGTTILLAVVVFMVVNFGWRAWQHYAWQRKENASIIYSQMLDAKVQQKDTEFSLFAEQLKQKFSSSVYAGFAAMMNAERAVAQNNLAAATRELTWVLKHAGKEEVRELAKVRLARIMLATNDGKAVISLLKQDHSPFYSVARCEVLGDALLTEHDEQGAALAYQQAAQDAAMQKLSSPLLRFKM